jgi:hypothetical protein
MRALELADRALRHADELTEARLRPSATDA